MYIRAETRLYIQKLVHLSSRRIVITPKYRLFLRTRYTYKRVRREERQREGKYRLRISLTR